MSELGAGPESDVTHGKRTLDLPDDDTSPAKRIKQTRDEHVATRRAEKEQRELERKAEKDKREVEKRLEKERREAGRRAEKEKREAERRAEKERKEQERRAEKERKEAEKAAEKERKEAEKAAEKERKEAEKAAEKAAEQQRKLKAQPRINLFFKKSEPKTTEAQSPVAPGVAADPDASSDYRTEILPFHTKIDGRLYSSVCNYEAGEAEPVQDPVAWLQSLALPVPAPRLSTQQFRSQLVLAQESSQVAALLAQLRLRRLQFSRLSSRHIENGRLPVNEEFRPPYVGTTRDLGEPAVALLAADPFRTDLDPSLNYEYDSEAEWDREDGDDLRDEDGDDSDEDGDDSDELNGFLSADDDDPSTRRSFVGPLTPVVVWGQEELARFSVEWLAVAPVDSLILLGEPMAQPDGNSKQSGTGAGASAAGGGATDASPAEVVSSITAKVGFDSLKRCMVLVNGNQANKTLLIELMKQQLPSATEKEVRTVLDKCAERVGKKKAEKRWVVRSDACSIFGIEYAAAVPGAALPIPSPSADLLRAGFVPAGLPHPVLTHPDIAPRSSDVP